MQQRTILAGQDAYLQRKKNGSNQSPKRYINYAYPKKQYS